MSRFELVQSRATAAEFHAREVSEPVRPEIWWHHVAAPALVLGSTQSSDVADAAACERAGVEVVRRRSGGGAVLLIPGEVTWIDVVLPAAGEGWADDVHAPMMWLGGHLAAAFESVGGGPVTVHDGALVSTPWSRLVCFDGLGPGEVLAGGRKLVGMSQRRTRNWARLQCCWYSRHDHDDLLELLAPGVRPASTDLGAIAAVPDELAAAVPAALLDHLR
ncbi:MAG: lipoyl protein ligase domain-containing protein [Ilumatobacteraceae bacterium]